MVPDSKMRWVSIAPCWALKEVRCERWLDYVLVNLDDNAAPLPEHLAPLDAFLSRVDLSVLRHGGSWEYTYPGNWKVAIEGGIEDYHVPWDIRK